MANNILGLVLPRTSFKITSDTSGPIPLAGLGVSLANLRLVSKVLKNQREDGVTIAHGRIILPSIIEFDVVVQTLDGIDTLNRIYQDIEGLYTVVSRGISFTNMRLQSQQISQSPEMLSASPIRISFKQALLQNDDMPICQQAPDSSTIDAGIANLSDLTDNIQTYITDKVSVLFS